MDPISISHPPTVPGISTAVPFTLEPNNHHAPSFSFANPTPPPPPPPAPAPAPAAAPAPNHPPYAEMIYTAIGALKEKDGSSKRAIGKYIEQVYRDLPPTHSDLLAQHLKHLKSNGLLVMVKKSYMLPRSESESDPHAPPLPPSTLQTPRGRGRPPKPKPSPQPLQPFYQHQPHLQLHPQPLPQNAEPVWAALGLGDDPAAAAAAAATATATAATPITQVKRRGPGRPPKIGVAAVGPPVPVRRGRPPGTGRPRLLKRVGRPPKPKSLSAMSNGLQRRPGRPPKNQSKLMVIPFAAPAAAAPAASGAPTVPPTFPTDSAPIGPPRPRGRPRKDSAAVPVGLGAPARGGTRGRGRGRGRGVLPVMRQGRPPKLAVVGRSKRPVGRPKGSTAAATAQKVANKDLRRKLEYFQSKVKESLGVLKPYFNHESPVTALAAIQELETLATSELNAPPLREETQPLQQLPQEAEPQPQPPPQLQMYHQQYPQIPPETQLQQLLQQHASAPS